MGVCSKLGLRKQLPPMVWSKCWARDAAAPPHGMVPTTLITHISKSIIKQSIFKGDGIIWSKIVEKRDIYSIYSK